MNLKVVHVTEKILSSLKMLKIKRLDSWIVTDAVLFRINFNFVLQINSWVFYKGSLL